MCLPRKRESLFDIAGEPLLAKCGQDKEQSKPQPCLGALNRSMNKVDANLFLFVKEIAGLLFEGAVQRALIPNQKGGTRPGRAHQFVRIPGDGVGELNTIKQFAMTGTEECSGSVGSIDVKPDSTTPTDLANGAQWVEVPQSGRACARDKRKHALAVGCDSGKHRQNTIGQDASIGTELKIVDVPLSNPKNAGSPRDRVVAFGRCEQGQIRWRTGLPHVRQKMGSCRNESREVRQRATVREYATAVNIRGIYITAVRSSCPPDLLEEPVHDKIFDGRGSRPHLEDSHRIVREAAEQRRESA